MPGGSTLIVLAVLAVAAIATVSTLDLTGMNAQHSVDTLRTLTDATVTSTNRFVDLAKAGTLDEETAKKEALATLAAMRYAGNEYFFVLDFDAHMVMHPIKPELDGKDLSASTDPAGARLFTDMAAIARNGGGFYSYLWPRPGATEPVAKTSYVQPVPAWRWAIGTGVYVDDVAAENRSAAIRALLVTVIVAVLLIGIASLLTRTFTRPMAALRSAMAALAEGRTTEVPGVDRLDEVGEMARAVDVFRRNAEERDVLRAEQEKADLERQRRREAVERLVAGFDRRRCPPSRCSDRRNDRPRPSGRRTDGGRRRDRTPRRGGNEGLRTVGRQCVRRRRGLRRSCAAPSPRFPSRSPVRRRYLARRRDGGRRQ